MTSRDNAAAGLNAAIAQLPETMQISKLALTELRVYAEQTLTNPAHENVDHIDPALAAGFRQAITLARCVLMLETRLNRNEGLPTLTNAQVAAILSEFV